MAFHSSRRSSHASLSDAGLEVQEAIWRDCEEVLLRSLSDELEGTLNIYLELGDLKPENMDAVREKAATIHQDLASQLTVPLLYLAKAAAEAQITPILSQYQTDLLDAGASNEDEEKDEEGFTKTRDGIVSSSKRLLSPRARKAVLAR